MKAQTKRMDSRNIRAFIDGICSIYTVNNDDTMTAARTGLRFAALTVGSVRYFAAKEQQHSIDKMIAVPYCPEPKANSVCVINGEQYDVIQVQEITDSLPRTWQLSLESIKEGNRHDIYTNAP